MRLSVAAPLLRFSGFRKLTRAKHKKSEQSKYAFEGKRCDLYTTASQDIETVLLRFHWGFRGSDLAASLFSPPQAAIWKQCLARATGEACSQTSAAWAVVP